MPLTRKQRRQVEKLIKTKSADEIAKELSVPLKEILDFLPKKYKSQAKNPPAVSDLKEVVLKTWLKENYLYLILLAVLALSVYVNGLNNDFLSDDIATIRDNEVITTWKFAFDRPFVFLRGFLYFVTANLFGKIPAAFRLPNILFHIGVTWLLYFLISKTISKKIAIFSSLIFSVHPFMSEAITWISGGYYPMYGFFVVLALFFYSFSKGHDRWYRLSLAAFLAGLFTSERVVYFPGILLVWELCFGDIKNNWKKSLPFFGLSGIWGLFFISGRIGQRINELQVTYYQRKTSQNPLFQIPVALSSYFELILWPKALTLYHSEMNFSKINFTLRFLVTTGYFSSLIYFFKKNKTIFFWLTFFFITLTPFLTPLGISWVVAERYAYLGSIGIIVGIGIVLDHILNKIIKKDWLFYFLTAILVFSLGIRTIYRNIDWKNQDNLWLAADKYSPSSAQNHNNLGDYYARYQHYDKSIAEFKRAIDLQVNYGDAYHNLANVYTLNNQIDLAIQNYQKAIESNPNLWQSYQNLGSLYFQQGQYTLAEQAFIEALKIFPQSTSLHYALGATYGNLNRKNEAKTEFQIVLNIDPQNSQAKEALDQLSVSP